MPVATYNLYDRPKGGDYWAQYLGRYWGGSDSSVSILIGGEYQYDTEYFSRAACGSDESMMVESQRSNIVKFTGP